jgi:hypothetical protein
MKNKLIKHGLTTAAAFALVVSAQAQDKPIFDSSFTLAANDAVAPGGGADASSPANDEAEQNAELVKKILNPIADLTSVPFQNNWDFGIGPADAMKYTLNFQPVIPFELNKDWNLISRTIVPFIDAQSPVQGGADHSGLGDITQSLFFSPKKEVGGWIVGAGPVLLLPSATESELGTGKWGAGPTAVVLQQQHGWTYGVLANQIWSYAGAAGRQNVNATFVQPFLAYTFKKTFTTIYFNSESTYDWQAKQWSVPVNFMVTQLVKIKGQPLSFQVGYRYYADGPNGGPDWGLRFQVNFVFPKK